MIVVACLLATGGTLISCFPPIDLARHPRSVMSDAPYTRGISAADIVRLSDEEGARLREASDISDMRYIKSVINRHGTANIVVDNNWARTALHYASLTGNDVVVAYLLKNGANKDLRDASGYLAIELAADGGHKAICLLLRRPDADVRLDEQSAEREIAVGALWKGLPLVLPREQGCFVRINGRDPAKGVLEALSAPERRLAPISQLANKSPGPVVSLTLQWLSRSEALVRLEFTYGELSWGGAQMEARFDYGYWLITIKYVLDHGGF